MEISVVVLSSPPLEERPLVINDRVTSLHPNLTSFISDLVHDRLRSGAKKFSERDIFQRQCFYSAALITQAADLIMVPKIWRTMH